jgi:6-pyruvoyltetrahydropterin/6-carboxytetrahydropterin synthase
MEISYEFLFDAAHNFPRMGEGHKYKGVHGHSFRVEVAVEGQVNPVTGFLADFAKLEDDCGKLREQLDHSFLNEIEGLTLPSLENISMWVWQRLKPSYPGLSRVTIRRDSCRQACTYAGD